MASFTTFLLTTSLILVIMVHIGESGSLGVNFGRQASQKLLPSMVVDMCLANGISKVKTFSVNEGVMSAFSGSNIELIVGIPNIELVDLPTEKSARDWMDRYITKYRNEENVNISYLCVGIEPFSRIERESNDTSFTEIVVNVLRNMDTIISNDTKLQGVKLGVPLEANILENASTPSEADFNKEFKSKVLDILKILSKTDSPFMINIYPYLTVKTSNLPLEFGLFDKRSNYTVTDGDRIYTNVFDFKYDSLVWALRKNGYGHVKIMVTQVGWPTDGGPGATVENAKRFYDGLLKKVASNQGTPLLPGTDLDVYLYVLSDENQRRVDRGPFERHYGIYDADGKPKFNIDFTLQGRDIEPESARGVSYLPRRWCILDEEKAAKVKKELVDNIYKEACIYGDCTAILENGSSCNFLEYKWKVSYAFNSLFQMKNQEVFGDAACDYNGLGRVVNDKPAVEGCDFPVQILSTLFLNGSSMTEMIATLGESADSAGERLLLSYPVIVIIHLLWIIGRWL